MPSGAGTMENITWDRPLWAQDHGAVAALCALFFKSRAGLMLQTASLLHEDYLPDGPRTRAITVVPEAMLGGARYIHIGKTLPWWTLFVAGVYPWKRPLRNSRCLERLKAQAYRPVVEQIEQTEEQLLLAPLNAEVLGEKKRNQVRACQREVVVSVPLKSIDDNGVLSKQGGHALQARVWLREGRLYLADEMPVLNALRAIALSEMEHAPPDAPSTPQKRSREAPREKTWWIGAGKWGAAHWLVRGADKKCKKFYVKHVDGDGEAGFERKKNLAKEEAEEYFESISI
jgi:hypothetical protein